MEQAKEWPHFTNINWNDEKYNKFNVDTRDFHVGYTLDDEHPDTEFLYKKYPKSFFHDELELKTLLQRYYDESGGKAEWRFFCLSGYENWQLKYIRIFRTNYGFLICDRENRAIRKDILARSVIKEQY